MRIFAILVSAVILGGCVSGAPRLTAEQSEKLKTIEVLNSEQTTAKPYTVLKEISAADCSGAPYGGRVWGDAEKAIEALKAKAVVLDADAVINTKCSAAPLVNNCWAAKVCSGIAVKW
ncbi:hypothetical protein [Arsukibacterium sp.]|uniref:hypothetical protein n=1 Tax=Arsukibacterium sp. TaxID=1977258 RepID=UPI00299EFA55|nr:hypothetical protein [Arsukibacterium sp.]MDX1538722.1 hypothetical protein [Arsukibacterium sp.]